MKKISRFFCIPFIIACMASILFIYYLSCLSEAFEIGSSIFVITILAFITILAGIFTDPTYIIKERLTKKEKK